MADFKRIVEILVKVTGDTGKQIEDIASNLKKIETAVTTLSTSAVAAVNNIDSLVGALSKVKDFQAPSLENFAKDIRSLSNIDPDRLSGIASALQELSKVRFNANIGTFFTKLAELNKVGDPTKITALADALARFGSIGKLPSLSAFSNNLKELSSIEKVPSLQGFANQLVTIGSVQHIPAIGAFVNNLAKLAAVGTVPDLGSLAKALERFQSINKLPDLAPFAQGLSAVAAISKPASFAALATSLKRLETVDVSKMPKAPELFLLARAVGSFSNIGNIPSITKFVNALQKLQSIGSINIPNFSQLVAEVNRLSAAFQNMAAVAPIITQLAQLGRQAQVLQQQQNQLTKAVGGTDTAFEKFGKKIKTYMIYRVIADSIVYLKEAITSGQDAIIDFDQSLKDLQAISGATDIEVMNMADTIKYVAATTKFSATEVAEGMVILAQAGFSASEASRAMEAVANLATGTLSDMSQTVDLISTSMNIFGMEATRASEIADMLANAINKSKLTVEKLRTAINYVGPVAEDAGISMGEMSAAMMTLANSGLRASTIGTGLRTIIGELIDPSSKLEAAANKAGIALSELDPRANSLSSVIQKLRLVLVDSQDALDIFGKRASSAALTLANTTVNGYEDMLAAVGKTGTAAAMAEKQMEGLGVAFKNLRDKLSLLAIEMGDGGIVQVMRGFVNIARDVADALITFFSNPINKTIGQFATLTTGIYLLIAALFKIKAAATGIRTITAAMLGLNAATNATTASAGRLSKALVASGIGIAITAAGFIMSQFSGKTQEAADKAAVLTEKVKALLDSNMSYSTKIAEAGSDTSKITEANKALFDELTKVASKSTEFGSEVSGAALVALQSFDSLTYEIKDSGLALAQYRDALESIKETKIREHFQEQEKAIKESTNSVGQNLANMGARAKEWILSIGMNEVATEVEKQAEFAIAARSATAKQFASDIANNKMTWADYATYIEEIKKRVDRTQEENNALGVYEKYAALAQEALMRIIEQGHNVSQMSTEDILKVAQDLQYVGAEGTNVFDALGASVEGYKNRVKGNASSITDMWVQSGVDIRGGLLMSMSTLGDDTEEVKNEVQKTLDSINFDSLDKMSDQRRSFINQMSALDAEYRDNNKEKDEDYERRKQKIQAGALKANSSHLKEENIQKQKALQEAIETFASSQEAINRNTKLSDAKRNEERVKIEREFLAKLSSIQTGAAVDPAIQERQLRARKDALDAQGAAELQAIAELEAAKTVTEEQANALRIQSTYNTLQAKLDASTEHFNSIKEAVDEDSAAWGRANDKKLEDQKALSDFIRKELVESIKDAARAQENLDKLQGGKQTIGGKQVEIKGKVYDENKKHNDTVEKAYDDHRDKIRDINRKSSEKILDIQEKFEDKLKRLREKREDGEKQTASDIADIYRGAQDLKDKVNQRGMSERRKEKEAEKAVYRDLAEAENMLAQARKDGDKAAADSAMDLFTKVRGMASDLESKSKAISGINRATQGMVGARALQDELDKAESLKDEAEARAVKERETNQELRNRDAALRKEAGAYKDIITAEGTRHSNEMRDLNLEIAKWQEKFNLAKATIAELDKASRASSSRTGVENVKSEIVAKVGSGKDDTATVNFQRIKADWDEVRAAVERGATITVDPTGALVAIERVKKALPSNLNSNVALGTDTAKKKADDLQRNVQGKLNNIEGEAKLGVDKSEVEDTTKSFKALDGSVANTEVKAEYEDLKDANKVLGKVDSTNPNIKASMNYKEVEEGKKAVESIEDKVETTIDVKGTEQLDKVEDTTKAIEENLDGADKTVDVDTSGITELEKIKALLKDIVDKAITVLAKAMGMDKLASMKSMIDSIKSKTVVITTIVKKVTGKEDGGLVSAFANGGQVQPQKYANGGNVFKRLSSPFINRGSGTKDDVPALLMKNEYVHKAAAVKKYGKRFMDMINNLELPTSAIRKFASGGIVGDFIQQFRTGGLVKKKRIEELFGPEGINLNFDSVNINNAISNVAKNTTESIGVKSIASMVSRFTNAISTFATGGAVSTDVMSREELNKLTKEYDQKIAAAKGQGQTEIAEILKKEKEELLALAENLKIELTSIKEERDTAVAERELAYKEDLESNKKSYEESKFYDERDYAEQVADDQKSFDRDDFDYNKGRSEDFDSFNAELEELKVGLSEEIEDYEKEVKEKEEEIAELEEKIKNYRESFAPDWKYKGIKGTGWFAEQSIEEILRAYNTPNSNSYSVQVGSPKGASYNSGISKGPISSFYYGNFQRGPGHVDEAAYNAHIKKYYEEYGDPLAELKKDLGRLVKENPQVEYDKEVKERTEEYTKDKEESEFERKRSLEDRALAVFRRDRSYKESRAEADRNYSEYKTEAEKSYKEDMLDYETTFDTETKRAKEEYAKNVSEVKSSAAKELEEAKARLAETLTSLDSDMKTATTKPSSSSTNTSVSDEVKDIPKSFGMSIDELLKRLGRGILRFNTGGIVPALKGSIPGKDSILAALTPKEYVMNARAVSTFGSGFFDSLNRLKIPRFNTGGLVGSSAIGDNISRVVHSIDLSFNGSHIGELSGSQSTVEGFIEALNMAKLRS